MKRVLSLILILGTFFYTSAQVMVHSLYELEPYLAQNDVNVKLASVTYTETADSITKVGLGEY